MSEFLPEGVVRIGAIWWSAERDKIIGALAKAQAKMGSVTKSNTAKVNSTKGDYSYRYADLAAVVDAATPALNEFGIAVVAAPSVENGGVEVTTMLAHESGQYVGGSVFMGLADMRPQAVGSAITYGRRYMLQSLTGLAPEDDDGAAAQGTHPVAAANAREYERRRREPAEKPVPKEVEPQEDPELLALWKRGGNTTKEAAQVLAGLMNSIGFLVGTEQAKEICGQIKSEVCGNVNPLERVSLWRLLVKRLYQKERELAEQAARRQAEGSQEITDDDLPPQMFPEEVASGQ